MTFKRTSYPLALKKKKTTREQPLAGNAYFVNSKGTPTLLTPKAPLTTKKAARKGLSLYSEDTVATIQGHN